ILINRSFVNVFTSVFPSAKIIRFASTAIDTDIGNADLTNLFDSFLLSVREMALIKSGLEIAVDDNFLTKFTSENTCNEDLSLTIEAQDGTQLNLFHVSHSISISRFANFEVPSLCLGTEFIVEQFTLLLARPFFGTWSWKFHVTRQFTQQDFEHLDPSYELRAFTTDGESQKGLLCLIEKKKYLEFTLDGNENPIMTVQIIRYS
ncbi:hypothetical protein PRIPAC_77446, partial [Pristionchus pacificus]|uniref:Uncharacterized protein n=1 Tax=Pristionchus pacificus TaxID=54126 RepID=A0A2A6BVB4_PRIPA